MKIHLHGYDKDTATTIQAYKHAPESWTPRKGFWKTKMKAKLLLMSPAWLGKTITWACEEVSH